MLWRQTIYFLGKSRNLAKFLARILIVRGADKRRNAAWRIGFLNRADDARGIRLETAVRVLHMICVT
jgi:hypothetical protein